MIEHYVGHPRIQAAPLPTVNALCSKRALPLMSMLQNLKTGLGWGVQWRWAQLWR
jgi:hypothetical protein